MRASLKLPKSTLETSILSDDQYDNLRCTDQYTVTNLLALQFFQGTKTACEDDSGFLGRLKRVFYPEEEEDVDDNDKRQQGKA